MEMSRAAPSILTKAGVNSSEAPPRTETILKLRESYLHPPFFKRISWVQKEFSWWQVPSDKSLMKQILESFDHQTESYSCLSHLWKEKLSWTLQLKPRSKTIFPRSKSPDRTIPFQVGKWESGSGVTTVSGFTPIVKNYAPQNGKSFPKNFGYQKMTPQKKCEATTVWFLSTFLPKNLRLRFLPSLPKASEIFCWERSHIPFFIRYFWVDDFPVPQVGYQNLLTWRVNNFLFGDVLLPSLCFRDTFHQWLWRTKNLLKLRHLFPSLLGEWCNVESLVSEERTGSNKTSYQFTSQDAYEIRCKTKTFQWTSHL